VSYILGILLQQSGAKNYKVLISGDSGTAKTSNILLFTRREECTKQ